MHVKCLTMIYNRCWAWNVSDLRHLYEADPRSRQTRHNHSTFQQHRQPTLWHVDVLHRVFSPEGNRADQGTDRRHAPVQRTRELRSYLYMVSVLCL